MFECGVISYLFYASAVLLLISLFFNLKLKQKLQSKTTKDSVLIKKAYFNPITDLPNQQNIEIMINEQINRTKRHKKTFVLAVVKILNYYDIKLRSTAIGEEFITEAAARIVDSVRTEDIVAHTTENGFVILCNEYLEEENFQIIFNRIENVFEKNIDINSKTSLPFKVSIGKSVFPTDAQTGEQLIHDATRKALKTF